MEIFRDKNLIVIAKPAGLDSESDIPELLRAKTGGSIYTVHRLDKAVGGVMLYARNKKSAAEFSSMFSCKDGLKKEYLAVIPDREDLPADGSFKDLLYHDSRSNKTFVVDRERSGVKAAELDYRILQRKNGLALACVSIKTGRSHQIRVQFASRRLPLAGDKKYGSRIAAKNIALWSCRITYKCPFSGEEKVFESLPADSYPWNNFDLSDVIIVKPEA